jgi:hypothetical protein
VKVQAPGPDSYARSVAGGSKERTVAERTKHENKGYPVR